MKDNRNLQINVNQDGLIETDDTELNKIIRAVENDSGSRLAMATPAITFGDDPTEKTYLVLLWIYPSDEIEESLKDWIIKTGRQDTYDYLKDLVKYEAIDPNRSFIMSADKTTEALGGKENIIFNDSKPITVFRFLKGMRDNNMILDGDEMFDIDEFKEDTEDGGDNTILSI